MVMEETKISANFTWWPSEDQDYDKDKHTHTQTCWVKMLKGSEVEEGGASWLGAQGRGRWADTGRVMSRPTGAT